MEWWQVASLVVWLLGVIFFRGGSLGDFVVALFWPITVPIVGVCIGVGLFLEVMFP